MNSQSAEMGWDEESDSSLVEVVAFVMQAFADNALAAADNLHT
jgi:hypothetical protein